MDRSRAPQAPHINIVQKDALDYCEEADDDVFYMFRPFTGEVFRSVVEKVAVGAARRHKALDIIYTERMLLPRSEVNALSENPAFRKIYEGGMLGQIFYVYRCDPGFQAQA